MGHARFLMMAALAALAIYSTPATAGYIVEVTFDDGDDGTGPDTGQGDVDNLQTNFSSLGNEPVAVSLTGSAHRSGYGEGYYGRGADLDGDGAVTLTGWDILSSSAGTIGMWLKARSASTGRLFHVEDTAALSLAAGELVLEVWDAQGGVTVVPFEVSWPGDSAYHHLAVVITTTEDGLAMSIAIDFVEAALLEGHLEAPPDDAEVTFGEDLDGLIDELTVLNDIASDNDVWDFDPGAECPEGLVCAEELIAFTPVQFPHQVPVRMKTVYDPDQCDAATPCPLLITVSGGGNCADNYAPRSNLEYYATDGFVAVTVDPYCEGGDGFDLYPMETSQLVAAKNHMMSDSPLAERIEGPDYVATGCSHGCNSVTHLMMFEEEFPSRTFGNSCSLDWILCPYVAGQLCPNTNTYLEELIIETIGSLDLSSPEGEAYYQTSPISVLSQETTANREFAASWGLSMDGEVCDDDGDSICYEESMWGMTYSSRRVRDIWQRLEPEGTPTGYFVENHEENCKHCASVNSVAFECGTCLLKHGRAGMADACPHCLAYEDETIEAGADSLECPIEADWYEDPLTAPIEEADDDDDSATDDDDEGGCECGVAHGAKHLDSGWYAVVLGLAVLLRRRSF